MSPTSYQLLYSAIDLDGGGRWIRTIEVVDNRFTVCPLWPLGNPSTKLIQKNGADYGTRTRNLLITNQLLYQLSYTSAIDEAIIVKANESVKGKIHPLSGEMVPQNGIEPSTQGFSVPCSTD